MSKTYRHGEKPAWSRQRRDDTFRCRHCKTLVGPVPYGGKQRNHCPYCLYSRHVDGRRPGDRAGECGGSMAPIAVFARPNGEEVIIHRCLSCAFERYNRVAADDDGELVARLPVVAPPQRRRDQADDDALIA